MSNYTFATLAVGAEYTFKVATLLDCVMKLTKGDLLIITDDSTEIETLIKNRGYEGSPRLTVKQLETVTPHAIWYDNRKFNFNLKILPTKVAYAMDKYDLIIHIDADAFMIGWDEESVQAFIDMPDQGLIARLRNRPCEEVGTHFILEPKATRLSIELINIKAKMPIEVFMMFKTRCPEFPKFIEEWSAIVERCHSRGIDPFMEALEIAYALSESKLPHHPVLDYIRIYHFIDMFRYLHHDKIMRII